MFLFRETAWRQNTLSSVTQERQLVLGVGKCATFSDAVEIVDALVFYKTAIVGIQLELVALTELIKKN